MKIKSARDLLSASARGWGGQFASRPHLALRAVISEEKPFSKDKSNASYSHVIAAEGYHLVAVKLPSNCTHFFLNRQATGVSK